MVRSNVSLVSSSSFENSIAIFAGVLKIQMIRFDMSFEVGTVTIVMVAMRTVVDAIGFLQEVSHPRLTCKNQS